ncbi:MAG: hypothetical protein AABY22_02610 [Nanoarchaeota archaeon]
MKITKIQGASLEDIVFQLSQTIQNSRFTANLENLTSKSLRISDIRLRDSKSYCGNHPKTCKFPNENHQKSKYLEGADWIEFNDLINDVLDSLKVAANVFNSVCIIRKGNKRRIKYNADKQFPNNTWQWNKDEIEEDCYFDNTNLRHSLVSIFPDGTPGVYSKINYKCIG